MYTGALAVGSYALQYKNVGELKYLGSIQVSQGRVA